MSGAFVREQLRTRVAALAPPGFVYVESVNLATPSKVLPPLHYSLDFPPATDERIALGMPGLYRESGTPSVQFFVAPQTGDVDACTAAESVRAGLIDWADATGQLRVLSVGPPNDIDGGDFRAGFYAMGIDVQYTYDHLEN